MKLNIKKILAQLTGLMVVGVPSLVQACPVCLGNPDAPMTKGVSVGILFMLGLLVAMFAGFAGFVFFLARRNSGLSSENEIPSESAPSEENQP